MTMTTQDFEIDGFTVTRALDNWSDKRFEAAVAGGKVRIIGGHPVPVVIIDRIFDRVVNPEPVSQYAFTRLSIDGQRLGRDIPYLEIDVYDTCLIGGEVTRWGCFVSYVDVTRNGRWKSRVAMQMTREGPATEEAVSEIIEQLVAQLPNMDYTSEWALEENRHQAFLALLGDFPVLPTRQAYEDACHAHGITPAVDGTMNYAARYYDAGVGGFSKLEPVAQLETTLHLRRGQAYLKEKEEKAAPSLTGVSGAAVNVPKSYTCSACGERGHAGAYPFSTAPSSGLCDDCL